MHVNAKKTAFGGLFLALTIICMALGSIIETNTLFLLAAASFFVGIVIRESGIGAGTAFYLAGILLGLILAPNKLYVLSYAAMGFYILAIEFAWKKLGTVTRKVNRKVMFWVIKYVLFNLMYLPMVLCFEKLLFAEEVSATILIPILLAGQIGLFIYDRAYEYVQAHIWNKVRGKFI